MAPYSSRMVSTPDMIGRPPASVMTTSAAYGATKASMSRAL